MFTPDSQQAEHDYKASMDQVEDEVDELEEFKEFIAFGRMKEKYPEMFGEVLKEAA